MLETSSLVKMGFKKDMDGSRKIRGKVAEIEEIEKKMSNVFSCPGLTPFLF